MYDQGKSDSSILPEKLPNKGRGAPRPAEEVEERGLAKGNLVQQNRVRTQWREALRRALEWIRQAVNACASEPEVGAQCGSSARWDLCGGCRVTGIPTATNAIYAQFSRLSLMLSQPATDGGIVHAKVFSDLAQCVSIVSVC